MWRTSMLCVDNLKLRISTTTILLDYAHTLHTCEYIVVTRTKHFILNSHTLNAFLRIML